MAPDPSQLSEPREKSLAIAARNLLIGVFLSGVPILSYLWLSVDMTYGSWAAVEMGRLVVAVSVPLLCGIMTFFWRQQVIQLLSNLLESVNLPF
ncbi:MAG: hypothetical protein AAGD09_22250 [Cyanobacteria bacterium P01_F01_bin.56]